MIVKNIILKIKYIIIKILFKLFNYNAICNSKKCYIYKKINLNITKDTFWKNKYIYVIDGPVRIINNVTLKIQNNTKILFKNKDKLIEFGTASSPNILLASSLIFESGSRLDAGSIISYSVDKNNHIDTNCLNAGFIFLGSTVTCNYDNFDINSIITGNKSSFKITSLSTNYLGNSEFKLNSITLIGCNYNEVFIENINIKNSGNDAVNLLWSNIHTHKISIYNPIKTSIVVSNSKLLVKYKLKLYQKTTFGSTFLFIDDTTSTDANVNFSTIDLKNNIKLYIDTISLTYNSNNINTDPDNVINPPFPILPDQPYYIRDILNNDVIIYNNFF